MGAGNPLYDVHAGIWTMLEARSDFCALVRVPNRIKFTADPREVLKRQVKPGDLPEVAVVQTGLGPWEGVASDDDLLQIVWEVWVTSGEEPFGSFFDVQFAIFRALVSWRELLRSTLTWSGSLYVVDCHLGNTEDSLLNKDLNRGNFGWSSVWRGHTDCEFSHTTLVGS